MVTNYPICGIVKSDSSVPFEITNVARIDVRPGWENFDKNGFHYEVTLSCGDRSERFEYSKGSAHFARYQYIPNGPEGLPSFKWYVATEQQRKADEKNFKRRIFPVPPTILEMSNSLKMDCQAVQDFVTWEDFAENFGLDTDKISDKAIYESYQDIYNRMRKLLGGKFGDWVTSPNTHIHHILGVAEFPGEHILELGMCDLYGEGKACNAGQLTLEFKRETYTEENGRRHWDTLEPVVGSVNFISICGRIWNKRHTDTDCCGQCTEEILKNFPTANVKRICELWDMYHLGDMCAGTKRQTEFLAQYQADNVCDVEIVRRFQSDHYTTSCEVLEKNGLNPDCGYKYGHGWLIKPVPECVIEELKLLFGI